MPTPDFRRPPEPYVARNEFRERTVQRPALPTFAAARERLPEPVLPGFPEWIELYWRAWEMAFARMQRPGPGSALLAAYLSTDDDVLLATDAAFASQFLVFGRRALPGIQSLDNFYARQQADGFLSRALAASDGRDLYAPFDPDGTGADILAWAEWRHYRQTADEDRLSQVIWPLLAHHRWQRANRTWPDGLYWATATSSGMSNQPRVPGGQHHHQHWSWVDASILAALNAGLLEKMAAQLAVEEPEAELTAERLLLYERINKRLWNSESAFYQDIDPRGGYSPVKSIAAYWALHDQGLVPPKRLETFVQHLSDPALFKVHGRVPSMSLDSDGFEPHSGDYWRGAVWPAATYMVNKGLQAVGQARLAHLIALAHVRQVSAVFLRTDTFWENYAPFADAAGDPARPDAIAQTGLAPIAMLLEDVLGVQVDWPARRVTWYRYLDSELPYGVRNYPLGPGGLLDMVGDSERVLIRSSASFTLHIRDRKLDLQIPIEEGENEIDLT